MNVKPGLTARLLGRDNGSTLTQGPDTTRVCKWGTHNAVRGVASTRFANRTNDRHGEVGSEDLAIVELFRLHDLQMRNLAADIITTGAIYDPPLVMPERDQFVVFDGNRRVTCLTLVLDPPRAPRADLRAYFANLRELIEATVADCLTCQVEIDRNVIDNIVHRRHTGSQREVGQLDWNGRVKLNFAERTGQGNSINVAAEVERVLREVDCPVGPSLGRH